MILKKTIKIELTQEEKEILYKADDIIKEIVDALAENKEQGFSAFQEGMNISDCFWNLRHHINQIDEEELIP